MTWSGISSVPTVCEEVGQPIFSKLPTVWKLRLLDVAGKAQRWQKFHISDALSCLPNLRATKLTCQSLQLGSEEKIKATHKFVL